MYSKTSKATFVSILSAAGVVTAADVQAYVEADESVYDWFCDAHGASSTYPAAYEAYASQVNLAR